MTNRSFETAANLRNRLRRELCAARDEIERLTANNVRLAETLIRVMAIVSEPGAVSASVLIRLSSLS